MYPIFRLCWQFWKTRKLPPLPLNGTHISHHWCLPWDLDPWRELNNGRTLTLYDMGRLPLARRVGLIKTLKTQRWGLTMAGVSVRYRKRVKCWQKVEMRSRAIGWDDKFFYILQSMWVDEVCANQALYRSAVTGKQGMVHPSEVLGVMNIDEKALTLPDWVQNWIDADATRPWPPE